MPVRERVCHRSYTAIDLWRHFQVRHVVANNIAVIAIKDFHHYDLLKRGIINTFGTSLKSFHPWRDVSWDVLKQSTFVYKNVTVFAKNDVGEIDFDSSPFDVATSSDDIYCTQLVQEIEAYNRVASAWASSPPPLKYYPFVQVYGIDLDVSTGLVRGIILQHFGTPIHGVNAVLETVHSYNRTVLALSCLGDLSIALHVLHACGVSHGDISCNNIVVASSRHRVDSVYSSSHWLNNVYFGDDDDSIDETITRQRWQKCVNNNAVSCLFKLIDFGLTEFVAPLTTINNIAPPCFEFDPSSCAEHLFTSSTTPIWHRTGNRRTHRTNGFEAPELVVEDSLHTNLFLCDQFGLVAAVMGLVIGTPSPFNLRYLPRTFLDIGCMMGWSNFDPMHVAPYVSFDAKDLFFGQISFTEMIKSELNASFDIPLDDECADVLFPMWDKRVILWLCAGVSCHSCRFNLASALKARNLVMSDARELDKSYIAFHPSIGELEKSHWIRRASLLGARTENRAALGYGFDDAAARPDCIGCIGVFLHALQNDVSQACRSTLQEHADNLNDSLEDAAYRILPSYLFELYLFNDILFDEIHAWRFGNEEINPNPDNNVMSVDNIDHSQANDVRFFIHDLSVNLGIDCGADGNTFVKLDDGKYAYKYHETSCLCEERAAIATYLQTAARAYVPDFLVRFIDIWREFRRVLLGPPPKNGVGTIHLPWPSGGTFDDCHSPARRQSYRSWWKALVDYFLVITEHDDEESLSPPHSQLCTLLERVVRKVVFASRVFRHGAHPQPLLRASPLRTTSYLFPPEFPASLLQHQQVMRQYFDAHENVVTSHNPQEVLAFRQFLESIFVDTNILSQFCLDTLAYAPRLLVDLRHESAHTIRRALLVFRHCFHDLWMYEIAKAVANASTNDDIIVATTTPPDMANFSQQCVVALFMSIALVTNVFTDDTILDTSNWTHTKLSLITVMSWACHQQEQLHPTVEKIMHMPLAALLSLETEIDRSVVFSLSPHPSGRAFRFPKFDHIYTNYLMTASTQLSKKPLTSDDASSSMSSSADGLLIALDEDCFGGMNRLNTTPASSFQRPDLRQLPMTSSSSSNSSSYTSSSSFSESVTATGHFTSADSKRWVRRTHMDSFDSVYRDFSEYVYNSFIHLPTHPILDTADTTSLLDLSAFDFDLSRSI